MNDHYITNIFPGHFIVLWNFNNRSLEWIR